MVNLASNLAALVTYLLGGAVIFALAVPGALCNVAGNWLGATLAIKKGAKFIRPLIFVSIGLLLVRILTDLIA